MWPGLLSKKQLWIFFSGATLFYVQAFAVPPGAILHQWALAGLPDKHVRDRALEELANFDVESLQNYWDLRRLYEQLKTGSRRVPGFTDEEIASRRGAESRYAREVFG